MILGIETSCDETSVALLERDGSVRVNLIASQIERHQPFGGVVPEIASREHLQHLFPLVDARARRRRTREWSDVESIAVTAGPGLIGALLVGVAGAQGLAYGLGIPLVRGESSRGPHLLALSCRREGPATAAAGAVSVAGRSPAGTPRSTTCAAATSTMLNRTRDDAIGETFDKVAKFIGLPYPGGPQIEKHGRDGHGRSEALPVPRAAVQGRVARLFVLAASRRARSVWRASTPFSVGRRSRGARRLLRHVSGRAVRAALRPARVSVWRAAGRADADGSRDRRRRRGERRVARADARTGAERAASSFGCRRSAYCTDNAAMIAFAGLQKGNAVDPRRVVARSRIG